MDLLDQKVIGYEATRNTLRQILDILRRRSIYEARGAAIPHGLLMVSEPGLWKSLMAGAFMEEAGRHCTVFHKKSDGESFLDGLRDAFLLAKKSAPSVLLLEDINLYADSPSPYGPQWAALQSGIDDVRDADVFVFATANTTACIPPSLLRPGRFDYRIDLEPPKGEIAERIVAHYLKDKPLEDGVIISDIVRALGRDISCAALETVMNVASINSCYRGAEKIGKVDLADAILQTVYHFKKDDGEKNPDILLQFEGNTATQQQIVKKSPRMKRRLMQGSLVRPVSTHSNGRKSRICPAVGKILLSRVLIVTGIFISVCRFTAVGYPVWAFSAKSCNDWSKLIPYNSCIEADGRV